MSTPPHDARAQALARALLAAPDPAACDQCLDALEDYVNSQLVGDEYAALLPAVAAHLDTCVACAESYAALYEVRLAEQQGTLPEPATIPSPDLSFLAPRPTLAELLKAAVERAGDTLRVTLAEPLVALLREAPRPPALALRDANDEPLFAIELPAPDPAVAALTLAAYPEAAGTCQVHVSVALPDKAWPDLAGLPVRLVGRAIERSARTDPWGEASFEGVPLTALPGLSVEVAVAASQ